MENWFRKKNDNEPVEDFVLFNENLEDTDNIDVEKIAAELDKKSKLKKKKLVISVIAGVLVVAMLTAIVFGAIALSDPLRGYAQVAAAKGNIEYMMDVSGVITAGNRYEITSLVSGKIIESDYEVGDAVKAGDVIYKLDDTEAKLSVERAKNELDRASSGSDSSVSSRICSTVEGTIKSLSIYAGANVNPGSIVAVITKADGTSEAVMTYTSGRVSMVNVRAGQSVSVGQVMASVDTKSGSSTTYDVKGGEINYQAAQRHLSNYTIQAPASGMIVEKNAKTGDNVAMTDTDKPMMVIVDTNNLAFTFSVDEYKLREVKKGQAVIIRTDSMPDDTFEGTVSAVGVEGYQGEDGRTMFDVIVTVTDAEGLMPGMKVNAQVVLTSVKKAMIVPKAALMKSDGVEAMVIVKYNEDEAIPEKILNKSLDNKLEYPDIDVPENCVLLTVEYGAADNDNVEIVSGIELGDIIVYKADAASEELIPSEYVSSYDYYDKTTEADEDILGIEESIEKEIEKIMQNEI